jgi:septal ring factor EnvC (AmiA/AmiB activator)
MAENGVYDVADLKEKIRRLRATRTALEDERRQLEADSAQLESQLASLRQELNIIGKVDKLQCAATDEFTEETNPESMKKFRIMNDKLEMKILNQEIRLALPQLEKEVKAWEAKSKGKMKSTLRNEKVQLQFPSMVLKSAEEIEEQIGQVLEERYRVKALVTNDIAARKKEKVEICTEIANLRRRLSVLSEEEAPLRIAHTKLKMALLSETAGHSSQHVR